MDKNEVTSSIKEVKDLGSVPEDAIAWAVGDKVIENILELY